MENTSLPPHNKRTSCAFYQAYADLHRYLVVVYHHYSPGVKAFISDRFDYIANKNEEGEAKKSISYPHFFFFSFRQFNLFIFI